MIDWLVGVPWPPVTSRLKMFMFPVGRAPGAPPADRNWLLITIPVVVLLLGLTLVKVAPLAPLRSPN